MGPIDKYVRYGLFPWKFLVHLALLFLTASQVLMIVSPEADYSTDTSFVVSDLFMTKGDGIGSYNPEVGNGENPSKAPVTLYTVDELVSFVRRTRDNYYVTLEDTEMLSSIYSNKNETTNEIVPLKMYTFTSNNAILG